MLLEEVGSVEKRGYCSNVPHEKRKKEAPYAINQQIFLLSPLWHVSCTERFIRYGRKNF
jgi:hypothetical protein